LVAGFIKVKGLILPDRSPHIFGFPGHRAFQRLPPCGNKSDPLVFGQFDGAAAEVPLTHQAFNQRPRNGLPVATAAFLFAMFGGFTWFAHEP
jgi:hypothetical protein